MKNVHIAQVTEKSVTIEDDLSQQMMKMSVANDDTNLFTKQAAWGERRACTSKFRRRRRLARNSRRRARIARGVPVSRVVVSHKRHGCRELVTILLDDLREVAHVLTGSRLSIVRSTCTVQMIK